MNVSSMTGPLVSNRGSAAYGAAKAAMDGMMRAVAIETASATSKARGNLVADAWLAALAIESGCEWVTTDGYFGRFNGLTWRTPFQQTLSSE